MRVLKSGEKDSSARIVQHGENQRPHLVLFYLLPVRCTATEQDPISASIDVILGAFVFFLTVLT